MSNAGSARWPALLSREEAAEYLGVSPSTISRLKASGQLHSVIIRDRMIKYRRTDLDHFIDALPTGDGVCAANNGR